MDVLTKKQRSYNMSRIRNRDTVAELMLRRALWAAGVRYRKNYKKIAGSPDIAITKRKIAVFVDGDFWHGRNHLDAPGEQIATNKKFWQKKLARNVERDREVNDELTQEGWLVLRFWETDVKKDIDGCVKKIMSFM